MGSFFCYLSWRFFDGVSGLMSFLYPADSHVKTYLVNGG
jgi:hypothetical protein